MYIYLQSKFIYPNPTISCSYIIHLYLQEISIIVLPVTKHTNTKEASRGICSTNVERHLCLLAQYQVALIEENRKCIFLPTILMSTRFTNSLH